MCLSVAVLAESAIVFSSMMDIPFLVLFPLTVLFLMNFPLASMTKTS